jgi:hypothetical protein
MLDPSDINPLALPSVALDALEISLDSLGLNPD